MVGSEAATQLHVLVQEVNDECSRSAHLLGIRPRVTQVPLAADPLQRGQISDQVVVSVISVALVLYFLLT